MFGVSFSLDITQNILTCDACTHATLQMGTVPYPCGLAHNTI